MLKSMGQKVKERREQLGMTQPELGGKIGVSTRTISKYETNVVKPRGNNLKKIAQVLDVSVLYLTNTETEDVDYGKAEVPYVETVRANYGGKAALDLEALLMQNRAMFAGGDIPQEDKDEFFQAIMEAYVETKQEAKRRFSPRNRENDSKE